MHAAMSAFDPDCVKTRAQLCGMARALVYAPWRGAFFSFHDFRGWWRLTDQMIGDLAG